MTSNSLDYEVRCDTTSTYPRLLVLTGSAPGTDGVGAILQRQILEELPREQLKIVTLVASRDAEKITADHPWVDTQLPRRYEFAYRPLPGLIGDWISLAGFSVLARRHFARLVKDTVASGREHNCEAVFAVLESPTVVFIAEQVARQLEVPLYCFVMDGPRLHIHDYGYGPRLSKQLLKAFDSAMHYASRIATAGEAMQQSYSKTYGKKAAILRQGVDYCPSDTLPEPPQNDEPVRIGFAGSMTARDAFAKLLEDLDRRHWKLSGSDVVLRIIGSYVKLIPTGPQHIEYFGWRTVPDMLRLMEECHFLYMPQPFSGHLREFAELSFPNKLCTYVPARRPIMLHAPPNASLPSFFNRFACGPRSTELSARSLLEETEETVFDTDAYRSFQRTVETAFRDELNQEQLRRQVHEFLESRGGEEL
jgi:hypothetical protein